MATKKPGAALALGMASQRLYGGLAQELGCDLEYTVTGKLIVAETETELAYIEELCAGQRAAARSCVVDGDVVRAQRGQGHDEASKLAFRRARVGDADPALPAGLPGAPSRLVRLRLDPLLRRDDVRRDLLRRVAVAVTMSAASERCPSGLRSATGNRVRAARCVAGSNPALSATKARASGPSASKRRRRDSNPRWRHSPP